MLNLLATKWKTIREVAKENKKTKKEKNSLSRNILYHTDCREVVKTADEGWTCRTYPRKKKKKQERKKKKYKERRKASNAEMLRTYATGLLAACLKNGGQLVEDVLTSGLSAKLM
ncbi:uncharacterized protein LOC127241143 [Andrographis paniculata]|uniref:uncharacterized protein LOC127241143 n=1 Tax=Andrographis paniculata TaxID=175694 RepID=UPI0021E8D1AD|nr:uncharacterized protein LOC127241143 [Andrographis paniculata]